MDMTQQEFIELTGLTLDAEQYQCIEEIYMTVDEDKQYFCELLKVMYKADRCTIEFMLQLGRKMIDGRRKAQQEKKKLKAEMDDVKEFLYDQFENPDEYEIKGKCKELFGRGNFLAKCIEDGKELSSGDVDFVSEVLREKDNK